MNHVSSHDQQSVSDIALFLCQTVSLIMSHIMTNRKWVTLLYSSIMAHSTMTNSKWVILLHFFARQSHKSCLIPWPTGGECHTLLYFFARQSHQPCIIPHQGVSDIYVFARQSHQSYLIPWPTVCEWHCLFLCNMSFLIIWLIGSEWHCIVSLPGSLRSTSHPTTNSKWVSLLYFFARQFHQLLCLIIWLIGSEFRHCCISLPCIISLHMTNRE